MDYPKREEDNVPGRRGFRGSGAEAGIPGTVALCAVLGEEDGPEVPNEPVQAPHFKCGEGKVQNQPQGDESLILPVELDRAFHKRSQRWMRAAAPAGSTEAEAAPAAALATAPPPRPLRYWGRRCRCDRGGRGWSSRRLQRAGAAEPCLDAQSRHLGGKKSAIYRKKKL